MRDTRSVLTRRVSVGDLRLFTRHASPGPEPSRYPVVLVHGLGMSSRYMLPALGALAADFDVYAPDLPGFGRSSRPPETLDIPALSQTLLAWMDALGLERPLLVGNSFGCQVILDLAVRHPARAAGLVLQGPTPDPYHRSLFRHGARLLLDAFLEPARLLPIAVSDYLRAGVLRFMQTFKLLVDDPVEEKLPLVRVPTLVVRGAHDPIVPQEWAERLVSALPDASLIVVPHAAHAVNFSHPDVLAGIVRTLAQRAGPVPTGAAAWSGA